MTTLKFNGAADITTVSKQGTNKYRGALFEYHEKTVFREPLVEAAFGS